MAEYLIVAGYRAITPCEIDTVRGKVEVDVCVEAPYDLVKRIICECKYWNTPVPKEKVHAFRTVVHDCGAELGIIISKEGYQSGAIEAAKFSNVRLETWDTFLELVKDKWIDNKLWSVKTMTAKIMNYRDTYEYEAERLTDEEYPRYKDSLGSKFLKKPVEGYYTNDKLSQGPYKMIVNCAENCYFTKSIAKAMIPQIIVKNVLCGLAFLTIAYIGIKDSLVAIPILQILLSTLFFTELVHHINFIEKLEQLFEQFKTFFINKPNEQQLLQEAVLFFLDYETTLAYNKAPLSDAVYERLNEQLSKEWEELKDRYEIYK